MFRTSPMPSPHPSSKRLSRATLENIGLFIASLVLYCFRLDTLPAQLEHFEVWVNNYLPILSKPWDQMYRDFAQVGHNDTNCSVNAPIWLVLVRTSIAAFGESPFAFRFPAVLLTIMAPVIAAEWVRRYFRKDLALLVGLVVSTHQHVLSFGRTGGYLGPTLSLMMAALLCASMIVFENRRRPWIGLALCLIVMPYFYSPIRYYLAVPFGMLGYRLATSKAFRVRHLLPLMATIIVALLSYIPLTQHGLKTALLTSISGRGEQFLLTERTVQGEFESEALPEKYRLSGVITEVIPERWSDLVNIYNKGNRFFSPRHQHLHYEEVWVPLRPWLLVSTALGVLYCLWKAFTLKRWLIPVVWSTWAWIPLLVTTGVSPNRLLLGLPSDALLLVLGVFTPAEIAGRFLPRPVSMVLKFIAWLALGWLCYHSVHSYFLDYELAPHL